MFLPPQGVRHAVTLLLTNRIRVMPKDPSPDVVQEELIRLADELVALAADMHAPPEASAWINDEYGRTIERLTCTFDIQSVRRYARDAFDRIGSGSEPGRRDLFLIYVPEDRLPVAAPLAIALTKRRLSVAFSSYEVATAGELQAAVDTGLAQHVAGVIVGSPAFHRAGLAGHLTPHPRLRVVTGGGACIDDLVAWVGRQL